MCLSVTALSAQQTARLSEQAVFLREPGGTRLAVLPAGTRISTARTRGDWVQITLEGWIWARSTDRTTRDGFDLLVSAGKGENLRAAPDGTVLARLDEGALLHRLRERGGWIQVRRTGWVARSALSRPRRSEPAAGLGAGTGAERGATGEKRDSAAAPPAAAPDTATRPAARAERKAILPRGAAVRRSAEGETLLELDAPAEVTVAGSDRDWVRVRFEGWVRASELAGSPPPPPEITAAMIREQPERYVGRAVEWRLQFLSVRRADELRPEMPLGQTYLLTRGPLPEAGFVYVVVSREQAAALTGLEPLDEILATVTIRSARTRYLATPVVELVRIEGR